MIKVWINEGVDLATERVAVERSTKNFHSQSVRLSDAAPTLEKSTSRENLGTKNMTKEES